MRKIGNTSHMLQYLIYDKFIQNEEYRINVRNKGNYTVQTCKYFRFVILSIYSIQNLLSHFFKYNFFLNYYNNRQYNKKRTKQHVIFSSENVIHIIIEKSECQCSLLLFNQFIATSQPKGLFLEQVKATTYSINQGSYT